ncbi:MAG: hypothetical protein NTY01_25425 [Verrucomicrobia bacterium]|nr:hypothetical protein [Verrucomicrobiota bacterium]
MKKPLDDDGVERLRKKPSTKTKATLDQIEWDFHSCPENEWEECWQWEFAREPAAKAIQTAVTHFRKATRRKTFDDYWRVATDDKRRFLSFPRPKRRRDLLYCSPEFPSQPYLSIKEQERKRRIAEIGEVRKVGGFSQWDLKEFISEIVSGEHDSCWLNVIGGTMQHGTSVAVLFDINWRLNNRELKERFAAWLKDHRPADVEQIESRGAGSRPRQCQADLKALGALRLLHVMPWNEATEVTQRELGKPGPLFSEQNRWIAAKRRAEKVIREFFQTTNA